MLTLGPFQMLTNKCNMHLPACLCQAPLYRYRERTISFSIVSTEIWRIVSEDFSHAFRISSSLNLRFPTPFILFLSWRIFFSPSVERWWFCRISSMINWNVAKSFFFFDERKWYFLKKGITWLISEFRLLTSKYQTPFGRPRSVPHCRCFLKRERITLSFCETLKHAETFHEVLKSGRGRKEILKLPSPSANPAR